MTQQLDMLEKQKIGFFEGFYHLIPEPILTAVFLDMSKKEMGLKKEEEVKTIILLKSLSFMTYHEFKALNPYLFTYKETSTRRPLVEILEESQSTFHSLKDWAKERLEVLLDE